MKPFDFLLDIGDISSAPPDKRLVRVVFKLYTNANSMFEAVCEKQDKNYVENAANN